MTTEIGRSGASAPSGHSPKGGAAEASPAQPGVPNADAAERDAALADCVGALQFILAFYEPGQSYLDTEAWKVACVRGVIAYRKAAALVGWPVCWAGGENGEVRREFSDQVPA